jgi:hypothetical protein
VLVQEQVLVQELEPESVQVPAQVQVTAHSKYPEAELLSGN